MEPTFPVKIAQLVCQPACLSLGRGELGDAAALPALQQALPAMCACYRLNERTVDARPRASGGLSAANP